MNDEWQTPRYLFRFAESLVGSFDHDVACTDDNALAPTLWANGGHKDAFLHSWRGKCWCNPPYSNIDGWVKYAFRQSATVVMLTPTPNGEARYADLMERAYELSIVGRIGFIDPQTSKPIKGNPRGSSLWVIGGHHGFPRGHRGFVIRDQLEAIYR